MKSRIEELARKVNCAPTKGPISITTAITTAVNEALELAAKEMDELSPNGLDISGGDAPHIVFQKTRAGGGKAIRKLKCS